MTSDGSSPNGREAALALHRAGRLEEAEAAYGRLLDTDPDDPDLMGLMGVLALEREDAGRAEALLRRAIAAPGAETTIRLRNLNNLFALLQRQGRGAEARELAACDVPDWPDGAAPTAAERETVLSLAEALGICDRPQRGLALVDGVLAHLGEDAEALGLAGRLRLKCGDAPGALPLLERAAALEPGDWRALAAQVMAHTALGDRAAARRAALRAARAAPVYLAPRQDGQRATVLVLNPAPRSIVSVDEGIGRVHYTRNYISTVCWQLADELRFASVIADLPEPPPELPAADVVFNNLASGEAMSTPGQLERAEALITEAGVPVINHPRAVAGTTRQRSAALLAGIPGLVVPEIARYARDMDRFEEIAADADARFSWPVIVRHTTADSSSKTRASENRTAALLHDPGEMRAFLARVTWPQFYVIQYVDLRRPDGNFRKLRAIFIDDEIVLGRGQYDRDWMVGGVAGKEFYDANPHCVREMHRILADPEGELGPGLMPVLREIRERVPLDVFGMDFDLDDAGRLVMFETQATMHFVPQTGGPDYYIAPKEPGDRIRAAHRRLFLERAGIAG